MASERAAIDEIDLRAWFRVARKWRWLLAAVWLIVVTCAAVYGFTATPRYDATTTLLVDVQAPNVVTFEEVIEERPVRRLDYLQTQYDMLQSRSLARRTLERLDLWSHPEFAAQDGDDASVLEDDDAAASRTVSRFLRNLRVSPLADTRLVDVTFRSADPQLAAQVVNTLASEHIARDREFRGQSSREASDWLRQRIDEYRDRVAASELALQRYREEHRTVSLEDSHDIVVQDLARLTAAATEASTDRIRKESRYRQIAAIRADAAALDAIPEVQQSAVIQDRKDRIADLRREQARLGENYGDRHPRMIEIRTAIETADEALRAEITTLIDSLRNEYLTAESHETALLAELDERNRTALALNRAGLEYGVLRREAESNRQIYDALLQRANETGVTGELRTSNVRVVDEAETPLAPASPNRRLVLLAGMLGGAALAFVLIVVLDRVDNRLILAEEVKEHLDLPVLGTMPAMTSGDLGGTTDEDQFAESMRFLRTNLIFSSAEQGCRRVAVTSTWSGEGKTLTAIRLAISLAQAYKRVLLIDADFRRPNVHTRLGVRMQPDPGLSNMLIDDARDAVRRNVVPTLPGLAVLPTGTIPPNPAELLGSDRFRRLVSSLAEEFDWIVVDVPPVMVVPDTVAVAHVVRDVIFMIDVTKPTRRAGAAALERLAQVDARCVGAVLNRVNPTGGAYYSKYYRREYAKYYRTG